MLVKQLIYSNSTVHTWHLTLGNIFICNLSLLTVLVSICPRFPCQDCAGSHYPSCHWRSTPPNQQLPYLCQLQATPPTFPPSPTASIIHAHLLHVQLLDLLVVGCTPDLNWSPVNLVFMFLSSFSLLFNGGVGSLYGLVVPLQCNLGALKPSICIPDAPVKGVIVKVPLAQLDILATAQINQIQVFKRDNGLVYDSW